VKVIARWQRWRERRRAIAIVGAPREGIDPEVWASAALRLQRDLTAENSYVRRDAALALAYHRDPRALRVLMEGLHSKDPLIRRATEKALADLSADERWWVDAALSALADRDARAAREDAAPNN
jgi:HEAT repeat protein